MLGYVLCFILGGMFGGGLTVLVLGAISSGKDALQCREDCVQLAVARLMRESSPWYGFRKKPPAVEFGAFDREV
jgi:hypothetical protein